MGFGAGRGRKTTENRRKQRNTGTLARTQVVLYQGSHRTARKPIKTWDKIDQKSDFGKRYGNKLPGMKLSDHRYPSEFALTANKRYDDDPEEQLYEIFRPPNS